MKRLEAAIVAALFSVASIGGGTAFAQDPDTAIKFNLSTPGARSLAMGGAFVALADDATAAYTNPAGLTNLTVGGSEVAIERRQTRFRSSFADRGHFSGVPGTDPLVSGLGSDTVIGLERGEAVSDSSGISFLSFAYVLPRGLVLALYRHEIANYRTGFTTQGPFADGPCSVGIPDRQQTPQGLCAGRITPRRSRTDLEIVNHGLSGAYEFALPPMGKVEHSLSVGLGVSFYRFELDVLDEFFSVRFLQEDDDRFDLLPRGFYGPPDFQDGNVLGEAAQRGDDDAVGFHFGWLWKIGIERWSVGGVFRQGPDFATVLDGRFGPEGERLCARQPEFCAGLPSPDSLGGAGVFHVPDVVGLGVAYRGAGDNTKLTLDFNRVHYSQRLADFAAGLVASQSAADFRIDDADQVHLGFERTVLVVESLFVGTARVGIWNEPFHDLRYLGSDETVRQLLDRPTDDEVHLSVGLGLVIKEDYQIDLAVDLSDPTDTVSFSLVKFF